MRVNDSYTGCPHSTYHYVISSLSRYGGLLECWGRLVMCGCFSHSSSVMSVTGTRNGAIILLSLLSDGGVCDSKSKGTSSDGGLDLGKDSIGHGLR